MDSPSATSSSNVELAAALKELLKMDCLNRRSVFAELTKSQIIELHNLLRADQRVYEHEEESKRWDSGPVIFGPGA